MRPANDATSVAPAAPAGLLRLHYRHVGSDRVGNKAILVGGVVHFIEFAQSRVAGPYKLPSNVLLLLSVACWERPGREAAPHGYYATRFLDNSGSGCRSKPA